MKIGRITFIRQGEDEPKKERLSTALLTLFFILVANNSTFSLYNKRLCKNQIIRSLLVMFIGTRILSHIRSVMYLKGDLNVV